MALTYEDIKDEFINLVNSDKQVTKIYAQIRSGDATYATANRLAIRVGEDLGKVLRKHAPLTSIDEWDLDDLIPKSLGLDHNIVTTACAQIQEQMNKDAKLNIKYQMPAFDGNKAYGIVEELRANPEFTNIEKTFYDQLVNFSESIVDDSIRDNAAIMYRSGVKTMVIRQSEYNCCDWCEEVAGSYDYADVKDKGNDVWRRHENCRCTIDYITERNGAMYRERTGAGYGLRAPQ